MIVSKTDLIHSLGLTLKVYVMCREKKKMIGKNLSYSEKTWLPLAWLFH